MERDYDGSAVIDADGNMIGSVERTFVDNYGAVRLVEVKLATPFGIRRLVLTDNPTLTEHGLELPFSRDMIEKSPDYSASGDEVEPDTLVDVRAHYVQPQSERAPASQHAANAGERPTQREIPARDVVGGQTGVDHSTGESPMASAGAGLRASEPTSSGQDPEFGEIVDRGDVIEIPILEEQLVKKVVVKEVLRVRKSQLNEVRSVEGDVRKESVEVEQTGDVAVRDERVNPTP